MSSKTVLMCYSASISFVFALVGLSAALWIYLDPKQDSLILLPLLFYTIMELLQTVQYFFVNQCSSSTNRFLTEIAYVLVIVQPLLWNLFFVLRSPPASSDRKIFLVGMVFAAVWLLFNLTGRLLYLRRPRRHINRRSIFSPPKNARYNACTRRFKNDHLFWEWSSTELYDFNANYLMYLMIWFLPALCSSSQVRYAGILMGSALVGLGFSFLSGVKTFPSIWCFISIPIILSLVLFGGQR